MVDAQKIVHQLLEAMDPKDLIGQGAEMQKEWLISFFPEELRPRLMAGNQFGPDDDFLEAMSSPKPTRAEWEYSDLDDLPPMPRRDQLGDWEQSYYACTLVVENGELWVELFEAPDRSHEFELDWKTGWGSEDHLYMRDLYSRRAYAQASLDYLLHVETMDRDPLGWVPATHGRLDALKDRFQRARVIDLRLPVHDREPFIVP